MCSAEDWGPRMPSRIDHVGTWHKVFAYLEPMAAACGKDQWRRTIPWAVFERDLELQRDACRSALNRALAECESIYGVSVVARTKDGFTIGVQQ